MIGILLAGGQARRLGGGDKGQHELGGVSIFERIKRRLGAQCDALVLNANGDPARLAQRGLPIIADDVPDRPGPLAGVLAGLDYVATNHPDTRFAITVPTDLPFFPVDLVARLRDAQLTSGAPIACARSRGRPHPLTALWSVSLRGDLRRALCEEDLFKVSAFVARHDVHYVDWPVEPFDPFFNINTPEDLAEANRICNQLD